MFGRDIIARNAPNPYFNQPDKLWLCSSSDEDDNDYRLSIKRKPNKPTPNDRAPKRRKPNVAKPNVRKPSNGTPDFINLSSSSDDDMDVPMQSNTNQNENENESERIQNAQKNQNNQKRDDRERQIQNVQSANSKSDDIESNSDEHTNTQNEQSAANREEAFISRIESRKKQQINSQTLEGNRKQQEQSAHDRLDAIDLELSEYPNANNRSQSSSHSVGSSQNFVSVEDNNTKYNIAFMLQFGGQTALDRALKAFRGDSFLLRSVITTLKGLITADPPIKDMNYRTFVERLLGPNDIGTNIVNFVFIAMMRSIDFIYHGMEIIRLIIRQDKYRRTLTDQLKFIINQQPDEMNELFSKIKGDSKVKELLNYINDADFRSIDLNDCSSDNSIIRQAFEQGDIDSLMQTDDRHDDTNEQQTNTQNEQSAANREEAFRSCIESRKKQQTILQTLEEERKQQGQSLHDRSDAIDLELSEHPNANNRSQSPSHSVRRSQNSDAMPVNSDNSPKTKHKYKIKPVPSENHDLHRYRNCKNYKKYRDDMVKATAHCANWKEIRRLQKKFILNRRSGQAPIKGLAGKVNDMFTWKHLMIERVKTKCHNDEITEMKQSLADLMQRNDPQTIIRENKRISQKNKRNRKAKEKLDKFMNEYNNKYVQKARSQNVPLQTIQTIVKILNGRVSKFTLDSPSYELFDLILALGKQSIGNGKFLEPSNLTRNDFKLNDFENWNRLTVQLDEKVNIMKAYCGDELDESHFWNPPKNRCRVVFISNPNVKKAKKFLVPVDLLVAYCQEAGKETGATDLSDWTKWIIFDLRSGDAVYNLLWEKASAMVFD